MGPGAIANFETLGYVDFRGSDYFRHGTHMHLSHIHEDVEAWYLNFDFDERVATAFKPNLQREAGHADGAAGAAGRLDRGRRAPRLPAARAGSATARRSRRRRGCSATSSPTDGTVYPKGTAIPVRADFNTLDNPFAWSERPDEIGVLPAAGVHFVVFNPTGDDFRRNRLAMDGVLPGGKIAFEPRARDAGLQLGALDDAPPELPRAAAAAPQLPARRALTARTGWSLSRRTPARRRTTRRGTVFSSAVASSSETATTSSPRSAAIWPNSPASTRSAAFSPKRVARMRSHAVGEPPRWTCPSTVTRVSKPVRLSISSPSRSPTPRFASSLWPNWSTSPLSSAPGSSQPSLIDDDREVLAARVPAAGSRRTPRRSRPAAPGSGSRRRRRRCRCARRSSRRGGPSPRRP